jgi:hypothetical protein
MFCSITTGLGLALAAFGRRRRRSLEEENTHEKVLDKANVLL